jgi:hypothetical protein
MPLIRLRIATLARLALRTQIEARTRGKIVSVNGGKPGQQPGFHFLHAEISSISRAGSGTQATKGPTLFKCPFKTKKKKPRRGGRGFFGFLWGEQCDGREAVTGSYIALGELRTTPSIMNILS